MPTFDAGPHGPTMAAVVTNNLFALFDLVSRSPLAERFESRQLLRWHTAVPHPWFNGVLSRAEPGADAEVVIEQTLAYFRARQVPFLTWWCTAELEPSGWYHLLHAHGLQRDRHTPGMAMDLETLQAAPPQPSGLTIAAVTDDATLRQWTQVLLAGFGGAAHAAAPLFELVASLGLAGSLRHYLGYLDGQPVASSSLLIADGVGGIYFVTSVPGARGRGIGAAMTIAPLSAARDLGCRTAILQASPMGFGLYRRLGFQQCGVLDHCFAGADVLAQSKSGGPL